MFAIPPSKTLRRALTACSAILALVATLSALAFVLSTRYLSFEVNPSRVGESQIFFDSGSGFSEANSKRFKLADANAWTRIDIRIPTAGMHRIRLDPNTFSGTYQFRNFGITGVWGQPIETFDVKTLVSERPESADVNQMKSIALDAQALTLTTVDPANDPLIVLPNLRAEDRSQQSGLYLVSSIVLGLLALLLARFLSPGNFRELAFLAAAAIITVTGLDLGGRPLWDTIELPFSNPLNVVGPLTLAHFNPSTNIARFLVYIIAPAAIVLTLWWAIRVEFTREGTLKHSPPATRLAILLSYAAVLVVICYVVVSSANSLATLPGLTFPLDTFHDGEFLTPAYNLMSGKGMWLGSFFIHGAFYDPLATVLGWKIWGYETIGAMRLTLQIWNSLVPIGVGMLLWVIAKNGAARFSPNDKAPFALFLMALLFAFLVTLGRYQYFDRRDVPVFAGLALLLLFLRHRQPALIFLAGLFSAITYVVSIDRGAYYSVAFVLAVAGMSISFRDLRILVAAVLGLALGWSAFLLCFGPDETKAFLTNTLLFYQTKDLFDSYVYQTPQTVWATLNGGFDASNIIPKLIAFCLTLTLMHFIADRKRATSTQFLTLCLLLLLSAFYFRSALGRSDNGHILYASSFAVITAAYLASMSICLIGRKTTAVLATLLTLANLALLWPGIRGILTADLANYGERALALSRLPDSAFLVEPEKSAVARLAEIFSSEECIFNYSSEAAIPYLVKKPTCGDIHIVWFASATPLRQRMLASLERHHPTYILFSSPHRANAMDGIPNSVRFPDVDAEIRARYSPFEDVNGWVVYMRNG